MARTFPGGTQVPSGYYIDASSFSFFNVEKDGGALPGGEGRKYLRVPTLVVMAAAPALGGLFVITLPFVGFAVLGKAVFRALAGSAREVAATVSNAPMPAGSTALTGKPAEKGAGEPALDAKAEQLAKEIEARRAGK
jgi:hypothetical protein